MNLKDELNKIANLKREYRQNELKYLGYKLREMNQENLIKEIGNLNFVELRLLFGAGIPGEAYTVALLKYQAFKKTMNEYEQKLG